MGACCTNDARDRKLDTKEAKLGQNQSQDDCADEQAGKKPVPSADDQPAFELNAKKLRSPSDHVNVSRTEDKG